MAQHCGTPHLYRADPTTVDTAPRPVPSPVSATEIAVRRTRYNVSVKPMLDRLVALVLIVLLLPVFAVVTIAVVASLGRPVLFRQRRVGLGGRTFDVVKFRTMRPCRRREHLLWPHEERRRVHKSAHDPRLTPVGQLLRTWSLDELPQLFNVLRGDMSLVGPRPELVEVVEKYPPHVHHRHAVRPGMTGLWQVSGRDSGLMCDHPELDLEYVERQSWKLDLAILAKTPYAVLVGQRGE